MFESGCWEERACWIIPDEGSSAITFVKCGERDDAAMPWPHPRSRRHVFCAVLGDCV